MTSFCVRGGACMQKDIISARYCLFLFVAVHFLSHPSNSWLHCISDTTNMQSSQYDASTLSLPLEHIYLPGRDPHLPVLFRVLDHHLLCNVSLASGSTYVFLWHFCQRKAKGHWILWGTSSPVSITSRHRWLRYIVVFNSVYIYIVYNLCVIQVICISNLAIWSLPGLMIALTKQVLDMGKITCPKVHYLQ